MEGGHRLSNFPLLRELRVFLIDVAWAGSLSA